MCLSSFIDFVSTIFFIFFILFKRKCITKGITNIVNFVSIWADVVFLNLQIYELTNKFKEFCNYHRILRFEHVIFLKLNFRIIFFTS